MNKSRFNRRNVCCISGNGSQAIKKEKYQRFLRKIRDRIAKFFVGLRCWWWLRSPNNNNSNNARNVNNDGDIDNNNNVNNTNNGVVPDLFLTEREKDGGLRQVSQASA